MGYAAITAFMNIDKMPPEKFIVSVILPGGCPLRCSYCIINQRDERCETASYSPEHLTEFLQQVNFHGLLGGVAVVGDEPLQTQAWRYAHPFLEKGRELGVPTALITNGYNLSSYVDDLARQTNTKIMVSLDGVGARHDALRGKAGAFARIDEGLLRASTVPQLKGRIIVGSICMPRNFDHLHEIITYAASRGLSEVMLSPLVQSSRNTPMHVHSKVLAASLTVIPVLMGHAEKVGIKLCLSDEFGIFGEWEAKLAETGINVMTPRRRAKLIRIDAVGRVETIDSIQQGISTGMALSPNVSGIAALVDQLLCAHNPVQLKAA